MLELARRVWGLVFFDAVLHADDFPALYCVLRYAQFCMAWRLYSYFNTPQIKIMHDKNKQNKIDVVYVGGAYGYRRDTMISMLCPAGRNGLLWLLRTWKSFRVMDCKTRCKKTWVTESKIWIPV